MKEIELAYQRDSQNTIDTSGCASADPTDPPQDASNTTWFVTVYDYTKSTVLFARAQMTHDPAVANRWFLKLPASLFGSPYLPLVARLEEFDALGTAGTLRLTEWRVLVDGG